MEAKKPVKIRIYCPEHQIGFDAEKDSDIYCKAGKHHLASEFPPQKDFWEYCCGCQRFMPFPVNDNARSTCVNCERKLKTRYFCHQCHTFTNDLAKPLKNKKFSVDTEGNVLPGCPACGAESKPKSLFLHECSTLKNSFYTSRETCKFCGINIKAEIETPATPENLDDLLPEVERVILENPNFVEYEEANKVRVLDTEIEDVEEDTIVVKQKPISVSIGTEVQQPADEPQIEQNQDVPNSESDKKKPSSFFGCLVVLGCIVAVVFLYSIKEKLYNNQPVANNNSKSNNIKTSANNSNKSSASSSKSSFRYNSKIILDGASLREEPEYNSYIINSVSNGVKIRVIDRKSNKSPWFKIKTETGDEGWLHGDYIDTPDWNALPCEAGEIGFISGGNLRSSPKHSPNESNILAIWDKGTKVKIIDVVEGEPSAKTGNPYWFRVEVMEGKCSFDTRNSASQSDSCENEIEGFMNGFLVSCDN